MQQNQQTGADEKCEGTIKHLSSKYAIARYELIKECNPEELQLYLFLKLYAINSHSAWPSIRTIKNELSWSNDKVLNTINVMKSKGRLVVEVGNGQNNIYNIEWYDFKNEGEKCSDKQNTNVPTSRTLGVPTSRTERVTKRNDQKENERQESPVHSLRKFFTDSCRTLKGFEPEMAFGKEGALLKQKLRRFSEEQVRDLISKFFNSAIGENLGYTLSVCLSAHTINLWQAGRLEKDKKPFYQDDPMVFKDNKWWVIQDGQWLEYCGKESEIVYK